MGSTVHLLVIDNRDSFVYNVVELLRSLPELTFEVIPEGELELSFASRARWAHSLPRARRAE